MSKYQFTLPSSSGSDFNSDEHLPLVVYFYPKDSTPGCTTEGLDFNARLEQFKALGYTVVGISRDGVENGEIAHEWRKVKVAGHAQEVLDTISQAS